MNPARAGLMFRLAEIVGLDLLVCLDEEADVEDR